MESICDYCDALLDETNESHGGFCHLCGAYSGESSYETNDDVDDDDLDLVQTDFSHVPAVLIDHYGRSESDLDVLIKLIRITYENGYSGKSIFVKSCDLVHMNGETAGQILSQREFEDVLLHLGGGLVRIPDPDGLGVLWIAISQRIRLHLPHDQTKDSLAELTGLTTQSNGSSRLPSWIGVRIRLCKALRRKRLSFSSGYPGSIYLSRWCGSTCTGKPQPPAPKRSSKWSRKVSESNPN